MKKLFVYGTLKRGFERHFVLEDSKFIGFAKLEKYSLISLGNFPTIKEDDEYNVFGEVYEVNEKIMLNLDIIEGFFKKKEVIVLINDKEYINVYTYVAPNDFNTKNFYSKLLKSGVWSI